MTKPIEAFFWLGPDGYIEGVSEEEFKQAQKNWKGERPDAYVQE